MFYSPEYMILSLIGMALVFLPQLLVKSTVKKYSKVKCAKGLTGADAAKYILKNAGITDISVEPTQGFLTDHYDPSGKVIRLSEDIYYGNSISSVGVAAHECGHAIQDKSGYIPMKLRAAVFPISALGQSFGPLLIMVGIGLRFLTHLGDLSFAVGMAGVVIYASVVAFHLVTLPVEFNASARAVRVLADGGYLQQNEVRGARNVLTAAAMTYVATALYALMELVYWVMQLMASRDRD